MTKSGEKIGCQKVGDMALHHITSIRSAGISMYYTHTHSTAKHFSTKKKYQTNHIFEQNTHAILQWQLTLRMDTSLGY